MDGFIILRAENSGRSFPACAYVRTWAAVSYQKTLDKWKKKVYNNSTIDKAICFSVRKSAVGNRPPRFAFLCVYAKGNTAEFDCSTVFLLAKWVLIVVKNVDISTLKFWGSFAQYSRNPFIFKGFRGIVVRFNSCRPHQICSFLRIFPEKLLFFCLYLANYTIIFCNLSIIWGENWGTIFSPISFFIHQILLLPFALS